MRNARARSSGVTTIDVGADFFGAVVAPALVAEPGVAFPAEVFAPAFFAGAGFGAGIHFEPVLSAPCRGGLGALRRCVLPVCRFMSAIVVEPQSARTEYFCTRVAVAC
jgi:hypothetical protein